MGLPFFAVKLKALREGAGITQAQLAEAAGLSQRAVSHWEQGLREPSWSNVIALCVALQVSSEVFWPPEVEKPGKPPPRSKKK